VDLSVQSKSHGSEIWHEGGPGTLPHIIL